MILENWGKKWRIHPRAILELKALFLDPLNTQPLPTANMSEAAVVQAVRYEASQKGSRLWRNNVGAMMTVDAGFVRFGLANDSTAINKHIKSADLIGIRPVVITQDMVGTTIGQFLSREIKHPGWKYVSTEREIAQLAWIQLITALGGDACFATRVGTI